MHLIHNAFSSLSLAFFRKTCSNKSQYVISVALKIRERAARCGTEKIPLGLPSLTVTVHCCGCVPSVTGLPQCSFFSSEDYCSLLWVCALNKVLNKSVAAAVPLILQLTAVRVLH